MSLRQISQSHLTLLDYCPRKFQYIYLDQLSSPTPLQEQANLNRGSYLHHLMQQQELHLPLPSIDPIPQSWPVEILQLYQMANTLITAIPKIDEATRFRQSEYRLHYEIEDILLTVVYDLLVLTDTHAYIFDWKTYSRPPDQTDLAAQWQTQLYPFVLAATSEYRPADITLSYWFVQSIVKQSESKVVEGLWQPDCIRFDYSDCLHQQIRNSLTQTLKHLKQWLADYNEGKSLPQTDRIQKRCNRCSFALRCERSLTSKPDQWTDLENIDAIEEVPLPSETL